MVNSAVQNSSLMGDDNVHLSILSTEILDLDKGDKVVVDGNEYTLRSKPSREMLSDTHFVTDVTFHGVMFELMKTIYRDTGVDGRSHSNTFDMTGCLADFMRVLIYNVERDYPGIWKFDEHGCPKTEPKTIHFSRQNCLQALQLLCSEDQFNYDFQITQENGVRTIHVGKFGSVILPPGGNKSFEWGKGGGLYALREQKVDDKSVITRLWVEGGSQNLRNGYRDYSTNLQLPYPKRLNRWRHELADGTIVNPNEEMIGIENEDKRYIEDAELRDAMGSDEDAEQFDVFPSRTGAVTAIYEGDINSFCDDSMDFDLNAKESDGTHKYLVDGVSAKINFLTGKLAGQQFELKKKGGYDHSSKKFALVPFKDERGLVVPTEANDAFRIQIGDQYNITDIQMPQSYLDKAEEELWYVGMDKFKERKQAKAQYELDLYRPYFLENLPQDSDVCIFKVGDYIPVKDDRFKIDKNIRIQKVARNLLSDHDYKITLSDVTAISIVSQTVVDVIEHDKIIEANKLKDLTRARIGWRTTEELRNMIFDPDNYFDPENIRPQSIDTLMLAVGAKSQQFVLTGVVLYPNFHGNPNIFDASAGKLAHLTIDNDGVRIWNMAAARMSVADPGGYYLYAKCAKAGGNGVWYLTREQLKTEIVEDPNNYYFQVGVLGSVQETANFRDFQTTYGFTRINGNTITTGKIVTADGGCYIDLDGNRFRMGDVNSSIDYNVTKDGQITLTNVLLKSGSGDYAHPGVFRGEYNRELTYFPGDEVTYAVEGVTSMYRWIHPEPGMAHTPTESLYWRVVAAGSQGKPGTPADYHEYRYAVNGSYLKAPDLDFTKRHPLGWDVNIPDVGRDQYLWETVAIIDGTDPEVLTNTWSTPIRRNPKDGAQGDPGAVQTYRGLYDKTKTYHGDSDRVEVVKHNGTYYRTTVDCGTISGIEPPDDRCWLPYGAQFESVATGLLLAENANIANFIFRNERMESTGSSPVVQFDENGVGTIVQVPNIILDGKNNLASFASGKVRFDGSRAIIGWLNVIAENLIGYAPDGKTERMKITPGNLPSIGALAKEVMVVPTAAGSDRQDVTVEYAGQSDFYAEYHGSYDNRDDDPYATPIENIRFPSWMEVEVPEDLTELNMRLYGGGTMDPGYSGIFSNAKISAKAYRWEYNSQKAKYEWVFVKYLVIKNEISKTLLDKGRYRIDMELTDIHCSSPGTWMARLWVIADNMKLITRAQQTILASNGIISTYNGCYMMFKVGEGFEVLVGDYGFKVADVGLQQRIPGSNDWKPLLTK